MAEIDLHHLDVNHKGVSRIGNKLVTLCLEDEGTELTVFFGGDPAKALERLARLSDALDAVASELVQAIDPTDLEVVR